VGEENYGKYGKKTEHTEKGRTMVIDSQSTIVPYFPSFFRMFRGFLLRSQK
jgi:hypothetical protein